MLFRFVALWFLLLETLAAYAAGSMFWIEQASAGAGSSALLAGWNVFKTGAGGYIRGEDIECDQGVGQCSASGTTTRFIRTDTYGAYVNDSNSTHWTQCLTTATMPSNSLTANTTLNSSWGVYEIAIAPSNTNTLYMVFNGYVWKSTNKCGSWTQTGLARQTNAGTNYGDSGFGRFMAVSPANANVVYLGVPAVGVYYTTNGGTSWTLISTSTIPATGGNGVGNQIAFDYSDAKGNTVYIASYSGGGGVWKCTGATTTPSCSKITSSPTSIRHMVVASAGVSGGGLWVVDDRGNVNKYNGSSWAQALSGKSNSWWSVAVDPANNNHVLAADEGGNQNVSNNGGSSWLGVRSNTSSNRTAADIPWLAVTSESYMTNGDMQFDPSQSSVVVFAEGIGVWTATVPKTATLMQWASQSIGIEQLVSVQALLPPGCSLPITTSWDRPLFYHSTPTGYPSTVKPPYNNVSIVGGWAIDYASSATNTIVALMNSNIMPEDFSGVSTDCGNTWNSASIGSELQYRRFDRCFHEHGLDFLLQPERQLLLDRQRWSELERDR